MLCPSGMYLTVVLVLVLAVALVSAGADTYDCNHWGYFQQSLTAYDEVYFQCLGQAQIDAMNGKSHLTIGAHRREIVANIKRCALIGKTPPYKTVDGTLSSRPIPSLHGWCGSFLN